MTNNSFEAKMKRIEEITSLLNGDSLTLEESIQLYEEGTNLIRQCDEILTSSKLKIEKIMAITDANEEADANETI